MTAAVVELQHCAVRLRGAHVLTDVSLSVPPSSVVGIKGENGSGKSTLLRAMAGLVRLSSGQARAFGVSPQSSEARSRIGAAIDPPAFYGWMSGNGFLRTLMDMSGAADNGRSAAALERFGLEGVGRKRVFRYSQGMKKRLALAAASLRDPDLLLLDEPTNALDPSGRRLVYDWIQAQRLNGAAVVIVTHRESDEEVCDRAYRLVDGRLVLQANVANHKSRPP